MRRDHLDDLVLVGAEPAQVLGRGEVTRPPLVLRERLVGDVADEVLQEAVLAVLGRARVGLDAEHLLAHERGEQRLELLLSEPVSAASAGRVNVLPSTAASWSSRRSSGARPSSRAAISACSVSGTSSASTSPVGAVDRPFLGEQAAVEQHPHRLDRVQRDALARVEDLVAQLLGSPGTRPASSSSIASRGERLQVERGEVALAGAPGRPPLEQLRPRERDHEESDELRDQSSRYSTKSSSDASAHCMSSKASTVG